MAPKCNSVSRFLAQTVTKFPSSPTFYLSSSSPKLVLLVLVVVVVSASNDGSLLFSSTRLCTTNATTCPFVFLPEYPDFRSTRERSVFRKGSRSKRNFQGTPASFTLVGDRTFFHSFFSPFYFGFSSPSVEHRTREILWIQISFESCF